VFEIVPKSEPKQAHRIRRFFLASAFSLMYLVSLAACYFAGVVRSGTVLQAAAIVLFIIAAFYVVFRLGFNRNYPDPSLTNGQLTASVVTMLYILAIDRGSREVFCAFVYVAFMFGMLRLSTRKLIVLAGATLAGYGAVILATDGGPAAPRAPDMLSWVLLTVTMPWMIVIGGYVRRLRSDLVSAHLRLEDIEEQARRDELTGVYNRRALMAVLSQEKRRTERAGRPFVVCVIDIDHFKNVNDSVGHIAGDEVLQRFAASVSHTVREIDTFGRYGGEEFLHVLAETSLRGGIAHADRIRDLAQRLDFASLGLQRGITVSIGVAEYMPGESILDTIGRADAALYRAKQAGRNCTMPTAGEVDDYEEAVVGGAA